MTRRKKPNPKPGDQFGELVIVMRGKSTVLCMCSCGRRVRYAIKKLPQAKVCRVCAGRPRQRNTKRPAETEAIKLSVEVSEEQAHRLAELARREDWDPQTTLLIAVERLLYSCGA